MKPKLIITVPDNKGWTRLLQSGFLWRLAHRSHTDPLFPFRCDEASYAPIFGVSTVHLAFNNCAQYALDHTSDPDDVWWLWDNDMEPNFDLCLNMLVSIRDCDILGAGVFNWLHFDDPDLGGLNAPFVLGCDKTAIQGDPTFTFSTTFPSMEPYEKAACATGGMMVKRKVLADPRMLTGPIDRPVPLFKITEKPNGVATRGLDLDFTYRATQLGYKLMVEPRANADHLQLLGMNAIITYGNWCGKQGYERGRKEVLEQIAKGEVPHEEIGNQHQALAQGTPAQEPGSGSGQADPGSQAPGC